MQPDDNNKLQSAYRVMYQKYQKVLRAIAYTKGVTLTEDMDDVIQETFLSYFAAGYPENWPEPQQKAMLVRILINKAIDLKRKNSHYEVQSLDVDTDFDEMAYLRRCHSPTLEEQYNSKEHIEEIRAVIEQLKPNWRNVAVLYFLEERTVKEICGILQLEEQPLRMKLSRIRKYLQTIIER